MSGSSEGGCLCGAVEFRVEGEPLWRVYCHCRDCQRASGAPVVAFAGYRIEEVEFPKGPPAVYDSSPGVRRSFCRVCGASVAYEDERLGGEIYLCSALFDDPEPLGPQEHSWCSQAIGWLHLEDGLPRHERSSRPR